MVGRLLNEEKNINWYALLFIVCFQFKMHQAILSHNNQQ